MIAVSLPVLVLSSKSFMVRALHTLTAGLPNIA